MDEPLRRYMTCPIRSVRPEASLATVFARLETHGISGLPVIDDAQALLGVVTRTDLIAVGRNSARGSGASALLELPALRARDVMSQRPVTVEWTDTIEAAAGRMVEHRVHRVYALDRSVTVGVVSTRDVMKAVQAAARTGTLRSIMARPPVAVEADEPLSAAVDLLADSRIGGVVVTDAERPVGLFTQLEALAARDLPPETAVRDVMDPALICLPVATPIARAARCALAMGVRRILAVEHRELRGIVTGLDFARYAAALPGSP